MNKDDKKPSTWNLEFYDIMVEFIRDKNLSYTQVLSFLTINFIGTLYQCGFDEDFVDATLDRMKKEFRRFKNDVEAKR